MRRALGVLLAGVVLGACGGGEPEAGPGRAESPASAAAESPGASAAAGEEAGAGTASAVTVVAKD